MHKTFTVTADPSLSEQWGSLTARIQMTEALAANAKGAVAEGAAAQLEQYAAERADLEPRIVAAARVITVDMLDPKTYARLRLEHAPRPGDAYDAAMGFNTDTFDGALMGASMRPVIDGNGDTVDTTWAELAQAMPYGHYEEIISAVLGMYDRRDAVPFSLTASAPTPG